MPSALERPMAPMTELKIASAKYGKPPEVLQHESRAAGASKNDRRKRREGRKPPEEAESGGFRAMSRAGGNWRKPAETPADGMRHAGPVVVDLLGITAQTSQTPSRFYSAESEPPLACTASSHLIFDVSAPQTPYTGAKELSCAVSRRSFCRAAKKLRRPAGPRKG